MDLGQRGGGGSSEDDVALGMEGEKYSHRFLFRQVLVFRRLYYSGISRIGQQRCKF